MKRPPLFKCFHWLGAFLGWAILAGSAQAQCPYNIEFLELADRFADVRFETDSPGNSPQFTIRLGESPSNLAAALDPNTPGGWSGSPPQAQITIRQRTITGLAPSTTYYFDVQVAKPSAPTTFGNWDLCEAQHCPSLGAQPGGYECVQVGDKRRPRFTTPSAQGTPPLPPIAPTHLPVSDAPPVVDGSAFPVTLDENGLCTNLQTQMNAAAAANPNLVHEVVVPAGGVCRPEAEGDVGFHLPGKQGTGTVIIRCDANAKLLPPAGIRMDPTFRSPENCSIESNIGDLDDNAAPLLDVATQGCASDGPCTEGWRFVGFSFALADHRSVVRNLWPVLDYNPSTRRITVPGDLRGKQIFDSLQVYLPGIRSPFAQRSCRINPVSYDAGSDTSNFTCGPSADGVYAGGGFVSDRISTPIANCEAGPDPICETAEPHPFGNYFQYSLLSVQGTKATLAGDHQLQTFHAVVVSGATGNCNGLYTIKGSSQGAGTIELRPDPAGDCTGGVVREVGAIAMFDAAGDGATDANKVHVLEVIDSTHIRLLGSTLSGATVGGWISLDPPVRTQLASLGRCTRCQMDRVLVHGGGKPVRLLFGFGWDRPTGSTYPTQGSILHSWVQDFGVWFPVHPVTQEASRSSTFAVLSSTTTMYSVTNALDFQLLNVGNYAIPGIAFYSQSGHDTCAQDVTVNRGLFYFPDSRIGGRPEAEGRYYASRHFFEFKCGRRVAIRGVDLRHNPANSQPSGAVLAMSIQNGLALDPPGSGTVDFTVEHNTMWDNSGAVDMVGPGSRISRTESTRRIRIAGNLVRTNRPVWKTTPSGQNGETSQPWGILPYYGEFIRNETPTTDLVVENNTIAEMMGGDTSFIKNSGQYDGTTVFRRNVFPFSKLFFGGITGSQSRYEPQTVGNAGFLGFINHYRRGSVTPDPFSEWDNVAIPCVQNTSSDEFETQMKTVNNEWNDAVSDFSCDGGCPSNFNTEIIGGPNETCLDRQAAFFKERMDYGKPASPEFPNYGVDVEELRNEMGLVRDVEIDLSLETTITISYLAPDSAACFVDYGQDKLFWTTEFDRISDGGGGVNRQVDLVDLIGSATYHFRILCSADQPRGVFTTGPGVPI